MKFLSFVSLTLVAGVFLSLSACGGGGSSTPALTADKITAATPVLIDGTTTITYDFGVLNDGKAVTFTVTPADAVLTNASVLVSGGTAHVTVTYPLRQAVTVTARIPGYVGVKTVQFIPQPDKAVVHLATDKTVSNLYNLTFGLNNDLGSAFVFSAIAPFKNYSSYTDPAKSTAFDAGNDVYSWFISVLGLNVAPNNAVLDVSFMKDAALTTPGIPTFSVFQYPGNPQDLSYRNYSGAFPDPSAQKNLTPSNFILSVDYYLGTDLLATK